jgi:methylated-DNA-[protein]-cysteine S-methyltransferase
LFPAIACWKPAGYADKMSANGGSISKRRLLSLEGAHGPVTGKTLFDVLLPVAPPRLQS